MKKIIDVSLTITPDMVLWPSHPQPKFTLLESMERGDVCNTTHCSMVAHVGTHIDAPHHFYPTGKGADEVDLSSLVGKAYVADLTKSSKCISAMDLRRIEEIERVKILLCKTQNSTLGMLQKKFDSSYIYIDKEAAEYLVAKNIKTLGVDYLSVEQYSSEHSPAHKILLGHEIILIEGLNLKSVPPGFYDFYCLPLKLKDSDGAPARAILVTE